MLEGIVDSASSAFLITYQSLGDNKPLACALTSSLNIVFKPLIITWLPSSSKTLLPS